MYDSDIDFLVNLGLLSIFFIFIVVIVLAWICQYVANSFFKNNHIIALNKNIKSRKMVESFLVDNTANLGMLSFNNDNISVNLFSSGLGYIGHMSGTVSKNSNDQYIINFEHRIETSFMLNVIVACIFPIGLILLLPAYNANEFLNDSMTVMRFNQDK
tara:strand:+ start:376 stop:849 length:474 start_codon:yes stop_codon:yes gene_type:complete